MAESLFFAADSIEKIKGEMFNDVREYFRMEFMPISLGILSQRYNKRARRLGVKVLDVLLSDDRLTIKMNRRGKRLIVVSADLVELYKDVPADDMYITMIKYWIGQGVPSPN